MPDFYGTEADFDAYCEARGITPADGDVEPALLRASVWIDGMFRSRFSGTRTEGRDQVRQWPRTGATDVDDEDIADDEVPVEVEQATYEAALRELTRPGSLTPDYVASTQVKRKKVGPIEVEYRDAYGADAVRPCVSVVEDILAPLLGHRTQILVGETGRA